MARAVGKNNPQTWTRLKRIELRDLATDVGNEALLLIDKWPQTGEGRAIKATAEKISRQLGGGQRTRTLRETFKDLSAGADELANVLANPFFLSEMAERPIKRRQRDKSPMGLLINRTIAETRDYIKNFEWPVETTPDTVAKLSELIPEQRLGPVFFDIIQDRLRIRHTNATPENADRINVEMAAAAIERQGNVLIEKLADVNYDRRITETVRDMVERVNSKQDIIELGIANLAAQLIFRAAEYEMADIAYAELQAFGVGLGMYVAQFPQWIRFSDNAASAEYTSVDIHRVYEASVKLANDLDNAKQNVDPEIPRTLRWMSEAIKDPRLAAKRAVFASIRTIENLIAVVIRTFSDWLGSIRDGVNSGTKKAVTVVTITGLLLAAASAGLYLSPASSYGIASGWVRTASEIVMKELAIK